MQEYALVIVTAFTYITHSVALYFSALQYIFILYLMPRKREREREREREKEREELLNFNRAQQYNSFRLYQ